MNVSNVNPTNACGRRKFTDEKLIELHSQGLSTRKLAKGLGVSRPPVCVRMKKLGLKPNCKAGGIPRYEKVGTDKFRCTACGKIKPLRQRHGTKCGKCHHERYVSTREGALRRRFTTKRCHARRKGIPFTLSFEYYRGLFEQQAGKDGYTGEQMSFDFGQGTSGATVSLDRIDNDKGYMNGNVKFCCLATNSKKQGKPVEQFLMQLSLNFPESN